VIPSSSPSPNFPSFLVFGVFPRLIQLHLFFSFPISHKMADLPQALPVDFPHPPKVFPLACLFVILLPPLILPRIVEVSIPVPFPFGKRATPLSRARSLLTLKKIAAALLSFSDLHLHFVFFVFYANIDSTLSRYAFREYPSSTWINSRCFPCRAPFLPAPNRSAFPPTGLYNNDPSSFGSPFNSVHPPPTSFPPLFPRSGSPLNHLSLPQTGDTHKEQSQPSFPFFIPLSYFRRRKRDNLLMFVLIRLPPFSFPNFSSVPP